MTRANRRRRYRRRKKIMRRAQCWLGQRWRVVRVDGDVAVARRTFVVEIETDEEKAE